MKNMKKMLSLLLCSAMTVSMVACGQAEDTATESAQQPEEQSTSAEQSASAETQEAETSGAEEVSGKSKAFEAFDETVTVKCVMGYSESTKEGISPSTCYWNDVLLERLNIELDWLWEVPNDQYNTKLSVSLASQQYPDVLQCDYETYNYLLESGALADLSDVWEEYASDALKESMDLPSDPLGSVTVDGKLMAIPYASPEWATMYCNFYRTDWLENVGLEVPTTIDELTAVIKAFRDDDPDGNGEKDTYALALGGGPFANNGGLTSYFNAFGSYPTAWIEKDGEIVHGMIQDETKEALDWLQGLYAEGYINPEFATWSAEQMQTAVADSKVGYISGQWSLPDGKYISTSQENCETATWGVSAVLSKEEGKVGYTQSSENLISSYNVVLASASEEAKIAMIKMLNMFYDYNFYDETGASGWEWFDRIYDKESEEYKAIDAKHYSWWLPVTIWNANDNLRKHIAATNLYKTGEVDLYLSKGSDITQNGWYRHAEYLHKDRSELTTEEDVEKWIAAYLRGLTRISSDLIGPCSIEILYGQEVAGEYVRNVFYGNETETGIAVSSTLTDYATEYVCKYIMGTAGESWDEFVNGWLAMGGEEWTKEVNEAYYATH